MFALFTYTEMLVPFSLHKAAAQGYDCGLRPSRMTSLLRRVTSWLRRVTSVPLSGRTGSPSVLVSLAGRTFCGCCYPSQAAPVFCALPLLWSSLKHNGLSMIYIDDSPMPFLPLYSSLLPPPALSSLRPPWHRRCRSHLFKAAFGRPARPTCTEICISAGRELPLPRGPGRARLRPLSFWGSGDCCLI